MKNAKEKAVKILFVLGAFLLAGWLPVDVSYVYAEDVSQAVGTVSAEGAEAVDNACNGVVRVFARVGNKYSSGSGFGVGSAGKKTDIFVTNFHVISDQDTGRVSEEVYILLDNQAVATTVTQGGAGQGNSYEILIKSINPDHMVPCRVLYTTGGYPDFAILQAERKVEGRIALPLMASEEMKRSENVYALGFPVNSDTANGASFYAASVKDVTVTKGVVSRFVKLEILGDTMAIQHDAQINHGNSGGPLVSPEGAVVAINTYVVGSIDGSSNTYSASIYADYAMTALNDLGLGYETVSSGQQPPPPGKDQEGGKKPDQEGGQKPDQNSQKEGNGSKQNKSKSESSGKKQENGEKDKQEEKEKAKQEEEEKAKQEEEEKAKQEEEEKAKQEEREKENKNQDEGESKEFITPKKSNNSNIYTPLYIMAAVFSVSFIVLLSRHFKEKKKNTNGNRNPQGSVQPIPSAPRPQEDQFRQGIKQDSGLRLQGVSGAFAGRRFAMNGRIRIGRDPARNEVVYPVNTPGISGVHCEILFREGKVFLRDLGSSYGTYINGRRIPPNQKIALHIGEEFYLGHQKESFVIARKRTR